MNPDSLGVFTHNVFAYDSLAHTHRTNEFMEAAFVVGPALAHDAAVGATVLLSAAAILFGPFLLYKLVSDLLSYLTTRRPPS